MNAGRIQTIEATAPTDHYFYLRGWRGLWLHFMDQVRGTPPARVRWILTMWVSEGRLATAEVKMQGAMLEPVRNIREWKGPPIMVSHQPPRTKK